MWKINSSYLHTQTHTHTYAHPQTQKSETFSVYQVISLLYIGLHVCAIRFIIWFQLTCLLDKASIIKLKRDSEINFFFQAGSNIDNKSLKWYKRGSSGTGSSRKSCNYLILNIILQATTVNQLLSCLNCLITF